MKTLLMILSLSLVVATGAALAEPYNVAGDFEGWNPDNDPMYDDGTNGDLVAGDGIYSLTMTVATAGRHEWKVATAGWASAWPGSNSWFFTTADDEDVLFTFDTNSHGDGWLPDSHIPYTDHTMPGSCVVVGDLGDELGGMDWDPAGILVMTDDGLNGDETAGDGYYTFSGSISSTGFYEWKVACNGGWGEQYSVDGAGVGSAGWNIEVVAVGVLYFVVDTNSGRIFWDTQAPVADEDLSWSDIKNLYR